MIKMYIKHLLCRVLKETVYNIFTPNKKKKIPMFISSNVHQIKTSTVILKSNFVGNI